MSELARIVTLRTGLQPRAPGPLNSQPQLNVEETTKMTQIDRERWSRVKGRLRAEVGEDIFSSWFARMELENIEADTAHLSVPTRFLKKIGRASCRERV